MARPKNSSPVNLNVRLRERVERLSERGGGDTYRENAQRESVCERERETERDRERQRARERERERTRKKERKRKGEQEVLQDQTNPRMVLPGMFDKPAAATRGST